MAKNILVTGASSGIGKAAAQYLSEQGYTVVLVARNEERLNTVANELPNPAYVYPCDLQKIEEIENIFMFCKEQGLKLDGMVHCAGITIDTPVRSIDLQDLEATTKINYISFIELGKYFGKKKYSSDGSSIVAISSMAANSCASGMCAYASSKAALNAAVKVMAKEFVKRKIRVNAIMPSYVATPMIAQIEESFAQNLEAQPLGVIEPEYIAYMIEFLLSDKSKYMTGAEIPISGGMRI